MSPTGTPSACAAPRPRATRWTTCSFRRHFSSTREDPTLRRAARPALRVSHAGPVSRSAPPAWRAASRAPCSTRSSSWQRASRRAVSGGWRTMRWCRAMSRACEARLDAARAYLVETLTDDLGHGGRHRRDRGAGAGARAAGLRARDPRGDRGGGLHLQGRRRRTRSSRARRSSAASATCTRCRSRPSPATRTSNPSAVFCAASSRRACSSRAPHVPAPRRQAARIAQPLQSLKRILLSDHGIASPVPRVTDFAVVLRCGWGSVERGRPEISNTFNNAGLRPTGCRISRNRRC